MESSLSYSGGSSSFPQQVQARNPSANLSVEDITVKLLSAAYAGDVPQVKKLAKRLAKAGKSMDEAVAEIKAPWNRGHGPLHLAAAAGKVETCKFLIKDLKVHVDTTGSIGVTPLILAIQHGCSAVIRFLLVHDADPSKAASNGVTPLHTAAAQDACELAELLLSKGAYVDPMWEKRTPLYIACQRGNARMMEILLQHQADPNAAVLLVHTPLKAAVFARSLEGVELLIKAGADVNAGQPVTPLIGAATAGFTDCVKCLLKADADANIPDNNGRVPIEIAAIKGWQECVEILLPVTTPLARVADWSIEGITQHAKLSRPNLQDPLLHENDKPDFEANGDAAFSDRDYALALNLYTKAVETDPGNSTLYAKRSLCSLHTGDKSNAMYDADTYKGMEPDLSKSCYAQGAALILVKEYDRACEVLMSGLHLDFESKLTDTASSGDHQ
ncbi:hypothetical protein BDA96_02G164800 [Sorghum bicolor]|uniref:Serine/threonine-protein kinase BSK1-like TPR repeats domain-containing protein n=2 Tax=Sorghum bicolor TaxID=4558 RepID=C5X8C2_SORBI|nr:ankyrin repeat and SOCS box protein 13 [Sorghum bicolor]EER98651.1 hypothetical protein SORBI_3002G158300 [Sorghum bicolor]KAG0543143.1 hypothetical protein BDA96_02G164800 [Sorghum bicolor]|eukprot:XP_002462130.1 ankyrin repeat and SOCS box protein 13 [Sorghum bicolor]